jgi:glycosyltransferase involved in cell wall biosynthesis
MSSEEGPRILFCAFAEVPGPTSAGTRMHQLLSAFSDDFAVDGMTLKGPDLAHIQRLGAARLMRVPIEGKPFLERLASYRRALQRQLSGDEYDLVYCADLFSAAVASAFRESQGFALVVEVTDFPSESFHLRWPVDPDNKRLRAEWREAERHALRHASHVIATSRHAARMLSERVDARRVHLIRRAVDRSVFAPPSMEVKLDPRRTVLVVGGREGGPRLAPLIPLLEALATTVANDGVRIVLAGPPPVDGDPVAGALAAMGIADSVELVDVDSTIRLATVLSDADVVVVPTIAEAELAPMSVPHRALEAMACRRPVVLTGPTEAFSDSLVAEDEAIVVPARSGDALAAAVQRLLDSPALREAISAAGERRIDKEFDLSLRVKELATFITDTVGVVMTPRAPESTSPYEEPSQTGARMPGPPPEEEKKEKDPSLPAPPASVSESGKTEATDFVVGAEPARPPPSDDPSKPFVASDGPSPFDALEPLATDVHERGELGSSVFTDEDAVGRPLAPPAPDAPEAVDPVASSVEASALDGVPAGASDTLVAPAPSGLQSLRVEQVPGLDSFDPGATQVADDWYGDTKIDPSATPELPSPIDPEADTARSPTAPSMTPSVSDLDSLPPVDALPADQQTESGRNDLVGVVADPWAGDTIADAGPVFTDPGEEPPRDTDGEESDTASVSQRNFLVDPAGETQPPANAALEDATVDDMSLPRDSDSKSDSQSDGKV